MIEDFFFDNMGKILLGVVVTIFVMMVIATANHKDTTCIGGYLFTNPMGTYSSPAQILDVNGKGMRCE